MANSKTLDDISDELEESNRLQKETNEHLNELADMFAQQMGYERHRDTREDREDKRQKGLARSREKMSRTGRQGSEFNILGAIATGDWFRALFGLPVAGAAIISLILGVTKLAQTAQEFFRKGDEAIAAVSDNFRAFIASVSGFMLFMKGFFGSFTTLWNMARAFPVIGGIFKGIETIFRGIYSLLGPVRKILTYFTGIHTLRGIFGVLGRFFNIILIFDSVLKGFVAGFRKWGELEGTNWGERFFISLVTGLAVGVKTFVKAFIDALPLLFKGINFVFDDLLLYVEKTGLPIISQLAGAVRNTFFWVREFLEVNSWIVDGFIGIVNNIKAWFEGWESDTDMFLSIIYGIGRDILKQIPDFFNRVKDQTMSAFNNWVPHEWKAWLRDFIDDAVDMIKETFTALLTDAQEMLRNLGVKWPDRWPWQRSEEQRREDEQRNLRRTEMAETRAERAEKAQDERDRAANRQKSTTVIQDNSVADHSVVQQNSTEIGQVARPYDSWHPGAIPQTAYHY